MHKNAYFIIFYAQGSEKLFLEMFTLSMPSSNPCLNAKLLSSLYRFDKVNTYKCH